MSVIDGSFDVSPYAACRMQGQVVVVNVALHNTDDQRPQPKCHLDRFSHFCRAHDRDRQTDRQTTYATPSVTIGRI